MVMASAAMAAKALTDTEQPPEARLRTLMDAHGRVLAARSPGVPLPFGVFRELLSGDLSRLLPDTVPAEEMDGVRLIAPDGSFEEDYFDLQVEQRVVLRALAKTTREGRTTSTEILEAEMDQDRVFSALRKRMDQDAYVHGRSSLIRTPAGPDKDLRRLNLPSSVAEFYRPITFDAVWDRWWFACPICRWPMRVTVHARRGGARTGSVRCFHRPHTAWGAAFTFKIPELGRPPVLVPGPPPARPVGEQAVLFADTTGHVPEPLPAEGHKALSRGVWRWTTIPGLVEIALYDALAERGLEPQLWPDLDAYDLYVRAGKGRAVREFRIDVKDYTSAILLAKKVQADGGDAGGADWLVVPDYRESSLPLLGRVCEEFDLDVATAGGIGALICRTAGVPWA
ncbi:hypothetical protein HCN08_30785 [Streptomyces sp. PRB2-1]|jgi:hypothetical protein|uniref:REase associating with pPIWI RE domain-containing protein n=2 Tax=Actinacidiphila epipremni TaxID=2053013 RepID=A0ABX0ZXS2_9ACTN|nr:hypothetical protein [Actinacidiphila epipremni]